MLFYLLSSGALVLWGVLFAVLVNCFDSFKRVGLVDGLEYELFLVKALQLFLDELFKDLTSDAR